MDPLEGSQGPSGVLGVTLKNTGLEQLPVL